jgi:hypothetical protein
MTETPATWTPRSGLDSFEGLIWLPRLLQKARRFAEGRRRGTDVMNGYLYGDNDAADKEVLNFLHTDDTTVTSLVEANPSDAEVARILLEQSGRTIEERQAFNASLKRKFFNFSMLEADEGRMKPGLRRSALCFLYNRILMPRFRASFLEAERKRGRT